MDELTVGSLFAGIGGFDLGLERAGMRTLWFCEQDPFCRRVLARHWPGVPCHPDVRALVADACRCGCEPGEHPLHAGQRDSVGGGEGLPGERSVPVPVPYVDVLCGGFPCQDISLAGRGAGLAGERSGLWRHFARIIGELRPRYVIVENVPALTARGLDVVLGDLAARGFDAEWDHLPASAFGAPHRRDRIWLVAYPDGQGPQGHGRERELGCIGSQIATGRSGAGKGTRLADADGTAGNGTRTASEALPRPSEVERPGRCGSGDSTGAAVPHAHGESLGRFAVAWPERGHWESEPDVGRVAHGVPARVDRLRALGNALVPQIAEWIGRQIMAWEEQA